MVSCMTGHGSRSSVFLSTHIPLLLKRYEIHYIVDDTCVEYFIHDADRHELVSKNLIISFASFTNGLYVSKFYPELYKQLNCKYLSAACFYIIIHHAAQYFHLKDRCVVQLETENSVFDSFYEKLKEFDFSIACRRTTQQVAVKGWYHNYRFDTHDIRPYVAA